MKGLYLGIVIFSILLFLGGIIFAFQAAYMLRSLETIRSMDDMGLYSPSLIKAQVQAVHAYWLFPTLLYAAIQLVVSILGLVKIKSGGYIAIAVITIVLSVIFILINLFSYCIGEKESITMAIVFSEILLVGYLIVSLLGLGKASEYHAEKLAAKEVGLDIRMG